MMPPMDDLHRLEAKGLARAKIRSKRRRVSTIRRRTIRGSLALFAIAWAVVFGQLVTGNDPALSRIHRTREPLASRRRSEQVANTPLRPTPELEEEGAVAQAEPEPAPEVEEPAPEAQSTPEPEPVVTSAS
jgi:outer membrane biosynthesis protein TonB